MTQSFIPESEKYKGDVLQYKPLEEQIDEREIVERVRFEIGEDREVFIDKDIVEEHFKQGRVNIIPFMDTVVFVTNEDYDILLKTSEDLKNGIR